jgi:hypothetical protein
MIIETYKIGGLYYIKNQYRRDLDCFVTSSAELSKIIENTTSYLPIIYLVEFWKQIPKFKKLTKTELKRLIGEQLAEKQKGWHKDHYNYNKAESWEIKPAKRKIPARNYSKR